MEFFFEQVNPNDTEYKINTILVKNGHQVHKGQLLFEIEGQKATIEIDAPKDGIFYSVWKEGDYADASEIAYYLLEDKNEIEELKKQIVNSDKHEAVTTEAEKVSNKDENKSANDSKNIVLKKNADEVELSRPSLLGTLKVAVLGGGGFMTQIAEALAGDNSKEFTGYFDDNYQLGQHLGHLDIQHITECFHQKKFDAAFVAFGDLILRKKYIELLLSQRIPIINIVHPTAYVCNTAELGFNVFVGINSVISHRACVGNGVAISNICNIEHHNHLGNYIIFGPGVMLSGNVTVKSNTILGAGVSVESNITIGENCYVCSGYGVINNLQNGTRVIEKAIKS